MSRWTTRAALGLKNGVWSSPGLVDTGTGTFTGLSCPTATFCMASDSGSVAYAETPAAGSRSPSTPAAAA
jgi:hypothetical protein